MTANRARAHARVTTAASPGGSRPSVDSHDPARISSSPTTAPAPGSSPSTAIPSARATTGAM